MGSKSNRSASTTEGLVAGARTSRYLPCRREDLDRAIAWLSQHAAHYAPLFRAIRDGGLALLPIIDRRRPWRGSELPAGRPVLVLIGDDDGATTGPAGWRAARGACAWARQGLVHGAAGDPSHYAAAAIAAAMHGRLLFVETSSAAAEAWCEALGDTPTTVVVPRGEQHPARLAREVVQ